MRNTLFAAVAAFAMIVGTAPTFAAGSTQGGGQGATETNNPPAVEQKTQTDSGALEKKCADIMANKADHTAAELAQCQKQ